jgi:hypothetical protein
MSREMAGMAVMANNMTVYRELDIWSYETKLRSREKLIVLIKIHQTAYL